MWRKKTEIGIFNTKPQEYTPLQVERNSITSGIHRITNALATAFSEESKYSNITPTYSNFLYLLFNHLLANCLRNIFIDFLRNIKNIIREI